MGCVSRKRPRTPHRSKREGKLWPRRFQTEQQGQERIGEQYEADHSKADFRQCDRAVRQTQQQHRGQLEGEGLLSPAASNLTRKYPSARRASYTGASSERRWAGTTNCRTDQAKRGGETMMEYDFADVLAWAVTIAVFVGYAMVLLWLKTKVKRKFRYWVRQPVLPDSRLAADTPYEYYRRSDDSL